MSKYLGIDFGAKNVGIAISDDAGEMAFPRVVLANNPALLKEVLEIVNSEKVKTVVIGESKDFKGGDNPIMKEISGFKAELQREGVSVEMEPEFLTSKEAEQVQGKNDMHDASAAAIILKSYLDRKNNAEN